MLVAVYGPRAVPPRREQADRAVVEVAVTPATATRGPALRSTSSCVASAVRSVLLVGLHPRTGVTVALQARCTAGWEVRARSCAARAQSVREDGATLAAAVNATVSAALDARLPLAGLLGACAACARVFRLGACSRARCATSRRHRCGAAWWCNAGGPNCARGAG